MIDVIVPVLGRPENAMPLVQSLHDSGADGYALITFVCTGGDKAEIRACRDTGANVLTVGWPAGPGDFARKINYGFQQTDGDYIFMGADDIEFTPKWDTIALNMMRGRIGVVATNDKANRQVMRGEFGTHCLISREFIDTLGGTYSQEPGVVLYEGYDHNFVDRELCDLAKSRRAFAFANRSIVRHRHPLWRTASWDPTYRKALKEFTADPRLFAERSRAWKRNRNRDIVA